MCVSNMIRCTVSKYQSKQESTVLSGNLIHHGSQYLSAFVCFCDDAEYNRYSVNIELLDPNSNCLALENLNFTPRTGSWEVLFYPFWKLCITQFSYRLKVTMKLTFQHISQFSMPLYTPIYK